MALGLVALVQPALAADRPMWRKLSPVGRKVPLVVRSGGVTVRFDPEHVTLPPGEGETEPDEIETTRITVTFPGQPSFVVPADEARLDVHGISLGIGRLGPGDSAPVVILEGYSGGMHCCGTFQMVVPSKASPTVLTLEGVDGGPARAFPRDVNGDGVRDIARQNDRFRYVFASGAGSWSPPQWFNLEGGRLVDVSARPAFAANWRAYAAETLRACRRKGEFEANGACAAYVAAMARLGQVEEGIATASPLVKWPAMFEPSLCKVPEDADGLCPDGQEQRFATFGEAIRWFLGQTGYIAPPSPISSRR